MFERLDSVHYFWFENGASSVYFFEYSDGLVAFDSSLYPQKFEEMTSIVEQKTSKVLKKLFFTHFHPDHTFGGIFSNRKIDIFLNRTTFDLLANMDKNFLMETSRIAEYNFNNLKEALNQKNIFIFEKSFFMVFQDSVIAAEVVGGHTPDSTIYTLKPQDYIITGDLVFSRVHAEILNSDLEEWMSILQKMKGLKVKKILPGHGKNGSKNLLLEQTRYLLDKKKDISLEKKYKDYALTELASL